ncbi:morphogenetic protein [Enterobacter sp. FS01]|nr:morphogenetic protein [Enterobacter sp. FS01]
MTERGMIFNGEMVRAILNGRKTQTRRPVKFPVIDKNMGCELAGNELAGELAAGNYWNSPFGKPGDRIWVRETFSTVPDHDEPAGCSALLYAADGNGPYGKWTPSIHMPRWASRITLEVTNVGVQRIRSISQNDAVREGLIKLPATGRYCLNQGHQYFGGASHDAREVFSWLWTSIYGDDSWQANPWVWVIEFKRIEGDDHATD